MLERARRDAAPAQSQDDRRRRLLRIASIALILLAGLHYGWTNASGLLWMGVLAIHTWSLMVLSYLTSARQPLFWLYVASSFAVALGVYLVVRRRQRVSDPDRHFGLRDFLRFCFPRSVWGQASAWLDVRYFLFDAIVLGLCGPVVAVVSVGAIASATQNFVSSLFESPPLANVGGAYAPALACTIYIVLLADFFVFVAHLLQHKVKFLWEFHKVHHSASVLHPLTAYRQHPVDTIMLAWSYALAGGLGTGMATALFGVFPGLVNIMGVAFLMFLFNLLFGNLRHSHVWLAWPPSLGRIFASPANHHIHHSAEARHLDKNFGAIFAIWDWMFGTLYLPRERETFRMGLVDGTETAEYSSILRLYGLPFVKNFQNTSRRLGA